MYKVKPTTRFSKDLKRIEKRGYKIDLLTDVIKKLAAGEKLEEKLSPAGSPLRIFSSSPRVGEYFVRSTK